MKNSIKAFIVIFIVVALIIAGWFIMYNRQSKNRLKLDVNTLTIEYSYKYALEEEKDKFNTDLNISKIYLNGEDAKNLIGYLKIMSKSNFKEDIKDEDLLATLVIDDTTIIKVDDKHISYTINNEKTILTNTSSFKKQLAKIYKERKEEIFREKSEIPKENIEEIVYEEIEYDLTGINRFKRGYYQIDNIVIITRGEFSTGGYDLEVEKVLKEEEITNIYVKEINPGTGSIVTQAFTYPTITIKLEELPTQLNVINQEGIKYKILN